MSDACNQIYIYVYPLLLLPLASLTHCGRRRTAMFICFSSECVFFPAHHYTLSRLPKPLSAMKYLENFQFYNIEFNSEYASLSLSKAAHFTFTNFLPSSSLSLSPLSRSAFYIPIENFAFISAHTRTTLLIILGFMTNYRC